MPDGQYRMHGQYPSDLLKVIGDDFMRHGLPKDAGIAINVANEAFYREVRAVWDPVRP